MSSSSFNCASHHSIDTSSFLPTASIRLLQLVVSIAGALIGCAFVYVLACRTSIHLHRNIRLALASLAIADTLACVQLALVAIYNIVTFSDDVCGANNWRLCALLFRLPFIAAVYAQLSAIIVLGIERTCATVDYRTYESNGSIHVGIVLIGVQWFLSFAMAILHYSLDNQEEFGNYCTIFYTNRIDYTIVYRVGAMLCIEIAAICLFIILLRINKRKRLDEFLNSALHSLTARYQLQENIRMLRALIPCVIVHLSLTAIGFTALIVIIAAARFDRNYIRLFESILLLLPPIYACIYPIITIRRSAQLRQSAKRAFPRLFASAAADDADGGMILTTPDAIITTNIRKSTSIIGSIHWSKQQKNRRFSDGCRRTSNMPSFRDDASVMIIEKRQVYNNTANDDEKELAIKKQSRQEIVERNSDQHFDLLSEMWHHKRKH